ncbi:MAG: methyltransferase domain-containing protein [Rhodospirillales bacterium]
MAATDKIFAGSVPELYDRVLVPLIFEPYARDLAERVAQSRPREVLETAAGTGVVTRAMAARLGRDARITATDLNQPMLDRATARQEGAGNVTWRQADALALPFQDHSFDVVVCEFGVMFFPDKVKGYSEARRVLKPGSRFLFNVWDKIAVNEFAAVVTDALAALFPNDPPRFMARTPHGYYDAAQIRAELHDAGFKQIAIDTVTHRSAGPVRDVAVAYCQGTPMRGEIEARDPAALERATEAAAQALTQRFGRGTIAGRIQALVITAS